MESGFVKLGGDTGGITVKILEGVHGVFNEDRIGEKNGSFPDRMGYLARPIGGSFRFRGRLWVQILIRSRLEEVRKRLERKG